MAAKKSHSLEELTDFAVEFIRQSGDEALSFYGKGESKIKFDESLVTKAELHLSEMFEKKVHNEFPEHKVFQRDREIKEYTHDEKRYLWIFDPLDGVANFQAGIPIWGMSLALFENFWPIFGVFFMPATGDIFYARAGSKAYRGKEEIHISPQENINNESLLFTFSRFHQHYNTKFSGKIRNLGCTAAHMCYVAMGKAEATIISNESYQDLAAASIIVEAAGGKIFKMDGEEFVLGEYLEKLRHGDHLLVAGPETIGQVRGSLGRKAG